MTVDNTSKSVRFISLETDVSVCPHLGLRGDRTVIAAVPTEAHVCYGTKKHFTPPTDYQISYCFSARHSICSLYREAEPKALQLTAKRPAARGSVVFHRSALWIRPVAWLAIVMMAVLLGIGLLYARQIFAPSRSQSAFFRTTDSANTAQVPSSPVPSLNPIDNQANAGAATQAKAKPQAAVIPGLFVTPTPEPGGQVLYITPKLQDVGWWVSDSNRQSNIGDSFLYSGFADDHTYVSCIRFDLSALPRGADIVQGNLRLTGLRNVQNASNNDGTWLIQLISQKSLARLDNADFLTVYSAPAAITLLPMLQPTNLAPNKVNSWELDKTVREWLKQQLIDGATIVTMRIIGPTSGSNALFAWDSGQGSESGGEPPALVLSVGPPPPTPPALPTQPVIVATLTPMPQNVLTVVADSTTATAQAYAFGTNTPIAYEVWTPTPFPQNLETVQAVAQAQNLPPVVLNTPIPANAATATSNADYATAVALTTGTFTPVSPDYVTPALIYPSPPAENVATAAARVLAATAVAERGMPIPTWPYNGVPAIYVYATPTPGNQATALALSHDEGAAISATGTPTPTPWNLVVITRVPPPTPTPIPLVVSASDITPTPTPTATRDVTDQDMAQFRNKIVFLSDRTGNTQTWVMDPAGTILSLVTDERIHQFAQDNLLAYSPDGKEQAIVQLDGNGTLQIKIYSLEYHSARQITTFASGISYDPAWSPRGDELAFVSSNTGGDEIYTTDPAGTITKRLTFNTWEWDKHPSWSSDGSKLVFFSNRGSGRKQIWIMNADGSDQRNLSNNEYNDWDPIWIR